MCDLYLVDDHALVREGLRAIVERGGHTVVGESAQFTEALAEIAARLPQVVLLDLDLGERSGLELLDEVRKRALPVRVLVISMSCRPGDVAAALRAGASGYVLKGSSGAVLLQAIDAAVRGQCFLAPAEADLALQGLAPQDTTALALSARERQILQLAAAGRSSAAIGSLLNLSPKTVESYRHRGMRKLGLADTPALVRWAIREGLMALDAP